MSRRSAIALIVGSRKKLLAEADERLPADAQPLYDAAAQLERLLLDVRAHRIDEFVLSQPAMHVMISAD